MTETVQLEPSDHCYMILQDHGPEDGGWGPAAIKLPSLGIGHGPLVYTGTNAKVIDKLEEVVVALKQETGKPTLLVRYTHRENVLLA